MARVRRRDVAEGFYKWYRCEIIRASAYGVMFAMLACAAAVGYVSGKAAIPPIAVAVVVAVFLLYVPHLILVIFSRRRVTLYFERPVDGPDTYARGEMLLRNSRVLDAYLVRQGLVPFSSYNSGDDRRGKKLQWYSARNALPVFEAMLSVVHERRLELCEAKELEVDLRLMIERLQRAAVSKTRFCLLLLDSLGTSGLEHAKREGYFFRTEVPL